MMLFMQKKPFIYVNPQRLTRTKYKKVKKFGKIGILQVQQPSILLKISDELF